jgi:hypothetical protein
MNDRISINGNTLFLDHRKLLFTEDNIDKYIVMSGKIIILTNSAISKRKDNVYCYNLSGEILWRIESSSRPIDFFNYYTEIYLKNGELKAYNFEGFEFTIDENNGIVLKKEFIK